MLTKTKIEYLDYCWNFYTGCKNTKGICPIADKCWARNMAHRFGKSFEPEFHPNKLRDPLRLKNLARIGVCFTGDLFGKWTEDEFWLDVLSAQVKAIIKSTPHNYFFLTKNPAGYSKWFTDKVPDNCYIGATVCNDNMLDTALYNLHNIHAKHKWLSIEPLMSELHVSPLDFYGVNFIVIGGWSNKADYKKYPINPEWIEELISSCDKAGVKVWLKNNLKPLLTGKLRQELPED